MPFGRTASGFAQEIGSTVSEANDYVSRYFAAHPDLKSWLDETKRAIDKNQGFVLLPSGRVLHVGEGTTWERQCRAVAYAVQGTAADIAKTALINLGRNLDGKGRIALFLHDEIVVETDEKHADEVKATMKRVMETPPDWLPDMPLRIEPEVRRTWGEVDGVR